MTKRKFLAVSVISLFLSPCAVQAQSKNLSSEMLSAYNSGFYPGVVRYAEEILKKQKDTIAAFRASVYEGESLFKMGRPEDAAEILRKYQMNGESVNPESIQLNAARFYWLGRCYFVQRKFNSAQKCFFASASVFDELKKTSPDTALLSADYYALSMLHGAKCYIELQKYDSAIPLYEYVISNGAKYPFEDYKNASLSLAQSYIYDLSAKNAKNCIKLVSSLEHADFDDESKYSLLILKGEAYESLGEYKEAYDTYSSVIRNAPAFLAATAMQKAYMVSTSHKNEVGSEAGEVLKKAGYRLSEYPDLLSEFWTRLAVDAFNAKDYKKADSYFSQGKLNASSSQKEIAAIYRSEIAYITAADKNEGSRQALTILGEAALTKSGSKNETILLSIARFSAYLKNWKDCEAYSSKCLKSDNPEIALNAVYWFSLSKYETGKTALAVAAIEEYKRTNQIENKALLNLYAKALAKQGKYHDADLIFYSLGEKNQLDNDGRLDYSRTLLIAGHYVSTKQQASKASGDEAVYLSALASFNQHRWKEAEAGFSKIINSRELDKDYRAYARFYAGYAQYQLGDYAKAISSLNVFVSENPLHTFVWSAHMTVARAASFSKNEAEALDSSQKAVKTARNEKDREESIILLAGIYAESKKYEDALSLLYPYLSQRNAFAYECKYKSAEILVILGRTGEAVRYFSELSLLTDKESALIAEESAYRCAEIAYSQENYSEAASLFEAYSKKWPSGRFAFASLYFSADSLEKTGNDIRAILRYHQITDSKSETSYRYGAEKNLVNLYQKIGDYAAALERTEAMLKTYGPQAKNDGMDKKIKELKNLGAASSLTMDDKILVAERTLARQKDKKEKVKENRDNATFLASAYRLKLENRKSAEMFLSAAKFSREAGDEENSARCFYGAVESFDAAAMYADAKKVFEEMTKLYPDNKYTKDGEKIIKQY